VTELVISELLWLNFSYPEKPVYVYLHSIGSQTPDGQAVGFDTEAYAILDTLAYIRPEIHTLVVGQVRVPWAGARCLLRGLVLAGCAFIPLRRIFQQHCRKLRVSMKDGMSEYAVWKAGHCSSS
jgi:hypothetical protein